MWHIIVLLVLLPCESFVPHHAPLHAASLRRSAGLLRPPAVTLRAVGEGLDAVVDAGLNRKNATDPVRMELSVLPESLPAILPLSDSAAPDGAAPGDAPGDATAVAAADEADSGRGDLGYKAILLCVAALWGTNFPAVRYLETFDVSSSSLAVARFGLAAAALLPTLIGKDRELILAAMECGLWAAIGYVAQALGLEGAEANKAAFLCSLHVVAVPLMSALLGIGERIKPKQWASAVLALLGVALLEGAGAKPPSVADALLLLQPLGFGFSYLRVQEASRRFPGEGLALSAGQLLTVALASVAWLGFDAVHGTPVHLANLMSSPAALGAVAYTGLLTTALTIYLQTLSLEFVSATDMTLIISTEPLVAAGVSAALLGEQMTRAGLLGGAIIFATCVWSELGGGSD